MPEDKVTIKYKTGDAKANRVLVDFKNGINQAKAHVDEIQAVMDAGIDADKLDGKHADDLKHNLLSDFHLDSLAGSVVLGDILHGNSTPKWTRLGGNTTTTKKYLQQVGTGSISAPPTWEQVSIVDISNPHKARAYLGSNQGSLAGSWTTVQMAGESYDPGSNYDTANYKFTAPVAGYYLVTITLRIEVSSSEVHGVRVGAGALQDGSWTPVSAFAYQEYVSGHSNNIVTIVATDIIYLAQNAYLIPRAIYLEGDGFGTILGGASGNVSSMAVHLLSVV